jgi:flagellar motility protein MotE (MotC chaperone)
MPAAHMPHALLLATLLLAFMADAHSQVALRPKHSTKEEYRACLKEEDALKAQREALQAQSKTHSANLKRIQDEMRAHVATQPLPGQADDVAVDAFNEKIATLNARIDASNQEAERLNHETHRLNTQVAAANQRCAGMVVAYADHQAVMKERRDAAKAR